MGVVDVTWRNAAHHPMGFLNMVFENRDTLGYVKQVFQSTKGNFSYKQLNQQMYIRRAVIDHLPITQIAAHQPIAYFWVQLLAVVSYLLLSVLYMWAISGTRGSSGFGSVNKEQIESNT
jgi:hypothetical protein